MDLLRRWLGRSGDGGPVEPVPAAAQRPVAPERETTRRVRRSLDEIAQELDLDNLEAQGVRRVRVVDKAAIEQIVTGLVDHAIRRRDVSLTAEERAQVQEVVRLRQRVDQLREDNEWLERAREDLQRRLEELDRERSQLSVRCEDLIAERWKLRRELEDLRTQLGGGDRPRAHAAAPAVLRTTEHAPRPSAAQLAAGGAGSDARRLDDLQRRLDELKASRTSPRDAGAPGAEPRG